MMIFGIDKPSGKLIHKMISRFLSELSILIYCLGADSKSRRKPHIL